MPGGVNGEGTTVHRTVPNPASFHTHSVRPALPQAGPQGAFGNVWAPPLCDKDGDPLAAEGTGTRVLNAQCSPHCGHCLPLSVAHPLVKGIHAVTGWFLSWVHLIGPTCPDTESSVVLRCGVRQRPHGVGRPPPQREATGNRAEEKGFPSRRPSDPKGSV